VGDLIFTFLEQWERHGLKEPALLEWLERFRVDKPAAALAWWKEVLRGTRDAFNDGADRIADVLTPGQEKKI
jgi:hypothetical protein